MIRWTLATALALFIAVVHWLLTAGFSIGRWAKGVPHTTLGYLPVILVIVLLIVRDLDSIAFGGLRLDMRRTRDDMARLTNVMRQRQSQGQSLYFNDAAAIAEAIATAFGKLSPGLVGQTPNAEPAADDEVLNKIAEGEQAPKVPVPVPAPVDASQGSNVTS